MILKEASDINDKKVLFFDGVCSLCNSSVDFIIKRDKDNIFYFSPLQSDYAKKALPKEITENLNTLVFLENGNIYLKSRAVFKILAYIKVGYWSYLRIFRFLPTVFTDLIYSLVSKYRYKIFGRRNECRLPTKEEQEKFIL